ncbi:hypothetical protein [Corynebacterium tuberculostearicum]|nr:hypothetical protein [Corynebacterium tuberculostearicum]MDK4230755.1 hypothetical protein [Corynebacterium tuberculostearicum]
MVHAQCEHLVPLRHERRHKRQRIRASGEPHRHCVVKVSGAHAAPTR